MTRRSPTRHQVGPHTRRSGARVQSYYRGKGFPHMRRAVSPRVVKLVGTPRTPLFLIDENLPLYLEHALRRRGYKTVHVSKIFVKGTPDNEITKYAEDHNAIIITRDTFSFPEPRTGGDRIVVKDLPKKKTLGEVLDRIKQLGW